MSDPTGRDENRREHCLAWELQQSAGVYKSTETMEVEMGLGKGALLWLIGIPLPIIILLALFWR